MTQPRTLIADQKIEDAILLLRGQKVLLDRDLASLYGVTTGNLNKAVNRNLDRFPEDFMFQLTAEEVLRSHRAVQVNVGVMRAFVRLREALSLHKELAHKLSELEHKIEGHDTAIHSLFEAIRKLMAPPLPGKPKEIGFHIKEDALPYRLNKKRTRV